MPNRKQILCPMTIHAAAALVLAAAACAPVQSAPRDTPATDPGTQPAPNPTPIPAPGPTPTPTPNPNPTPIPNPAPTPVASQQVKLTQLSREALNGRSGYAELGLRGDNKATGTEARLREGVSGQMPQRVPYEIEGLYVMIADSTADGWFVLYRTPLDQWTSKNENPRYFAALYSLDGARKWGRPLNPVLSAPKHLEIQDARYEGGKLYFNEACQSYSAEAGGRCSSLVRMDAATGAVDWRTSPLVSNNMFLLRGPYVVTGYGFTREPDHLYVLDRETGRTLTRVPVDSAPSYLEFRGDDLWVVTYSSLYRFRFEG